MNGLLGTPIGADANLRSLVRQYFHAREEQPVGTVPSTPHVATTWNTRTLNAVLHDDIGVRLSGNRLIVPAGTYTARFYGPVMNGSANKVRLRDMVRGVTVAVGGNNYTEPGGDGGYVMTRGIAKGWFTLNSDTALEFQHYVTDAGPSTWTMGIPIGSLGQPVEVYGQVQLWRVAA